LSRRIWQTSERAHAREPMRPCARERGCPDRPTGRGAASGDGLQVGGTFVDASRQGARDERSGCESLEDVRQVGPPVETLDDTFVRTVREPFAQHRLDEQTLEPRGETLDIPGVCEQ